MLLGRKGFVKIAVETGLDGGIVPIYYFGNTQVLLAELLWSTGPA